MTPANSIFAGSGTTIFTVMSALADQHGAINLGQGFPDEDGPEDIRRVAAEALIAGPNQYPPMMGLPELRQAVAAHERRFYGLEIEWQRQVLITSGATEGLAAACLGLLNPGDEVVVFEPLYDSYLPMLRRAGANVRPLRLEPPDWALDADRLAAAFGPRTRMVLLNSPMNPAAKVFTPAELDVIADLLCDHDAVAVCDEVYEHLVFSGSAHVPLATRPGMAGRAVRIGSAGKIFSLTGWKVGYLSGPEDLIAAIARAHQFLTFTTPPDLQRAVAYGLKKDDKYFRALSGDLEEKRDLLSEGLRDIGFETLPCEGSYFVIADIRPLGFDGTDADFCRHITEHAGVAAVPVSAFYDRGGPDHLVRFCFCKRPDVLRRALRRLAAHFG